MSAMQLIVWVIIGALAGVIVSFILNRGRGTFSIGYTVLGMIGAVIGGFLFDALNIQLAGLSATVTLTDLVAAVVGSFILLIVLSLIRRR